MDFDARTATATPAYSDVLILGSAGPTAERDKQYADPEHAWQDR